MKKNVFFVLMELPTLVIVFISSFTLVELTIALQVAGADNKDIHYCINSIVIVCYVFIKIILFFIKRYMTKKDSKL